MILLRGNAGSSQEEELCLFDAPAGAPRSALKADGLPSKPVSASPGISKA